MKWILIEENDGLDMHNLDTDNQDLGIHQDLDSDNQDLVFVFESQWKIKHV